MPGMAALVVERRGGLLKSLARKRRPVIARSGATKQSRSAEHNAAEIASLRSQ
jgi:hypothetical protein